MIEILIYAFFKENRLATVARNGAVVTWDLKRSTRSKLDQVYKDHERPVNKVSLSSLLLAIMACMKFFFRLIIIPMNLFY